MRKIKLEDLPHYEYADYSQWEGRWEIIKGVPFAMSPSPGLYHSHLMAQILTQSAKLLESCLEYTVILPIDYKISEDTVVQPDILVFRTPEIYCDYLIDTPEILFEILSTATKHKDLNLKYQIYEEAGVKYYVIVDPVLKQCFVYHLVDGKYILALTTETGNFVFDTDGCTIDFDFGKIW